MKVSSAWTVCYGKRNWKAQEKKRTSFAKSMELNSNVIKKNPSTIAFSRRFRVEVKASHISEDPCPDKMLE